MNKRPDPYESDSFPRWSVVWGMPALLLAAVLLLYFRDPSTEGLISCSFYRLTGLYCTGCGTTRAFHALLHGRLLEAFRYNVFMLLWLPLPLYAMFAYWLRRLLYRPVLPEIKKWRHPLIILAITSILFLLARNIPFAPFSWLAP